MTSPNKDSKWFRELCDEGCQICGTKLHGKNNGLEWSHIISTKDGGKNEQDNCLALCPNCAYALDFVIKPAVFKAAKKYSKKKVPESWVDGEGRITQ